MAERRPRSSILFDLFAASQQVKSLLAAAMDGSGLRADDYAVYSALVEFGPLTPTELGRVVGMPPTTVSHYIRAMRERHHIDEARNPADSRSRVLTLSTAGLAAHKKANLAFEEAYRRFVVRLADPTAAKQAMVEIERAAAGALADLLEDATAQAG
jgi:DNA-binding MarR family transcriptional regulator